MTFKSGSKWCGNKNGRPLGSSNIPVDFRNALTKKIVMKHHEDTEDIIQIVINNAKLEKEWALKLYITGVLPYYLVKPKAEIEDSTLNNSAIRGSLADFPKEILMKIMQLIVDGADGNNAISDNEEETDNNSNEIIEEIEKDE